MRGYIRDAVYYYEYLSGEGGWRLPKREKNLKPMVSNPTAPCRVRLLSYSCRIRRLYAKTGQAMRCFNKPSRPSRAGAGGALSFASLFDSSCPLHPVLPAAPGVFTGATGPGALVLVTHDRYLLDRVSGALPALGDGDHGFFGDLDRWGGWKAARKTSQKTR